MSPAGSSTDVPGPHPVSSQDPVARRGTEGESDQNRQPVEHLSWRRRDAVDRKRALPGVPDPEDQSQCRGEHACAQCEGNALNVGEYVGIEGPGDADHDDREPVDEGHVAIQSQLPCQDRDQHHSED